jgi:hypothetical protein
MARRTRTRTNNAGCLALPFAVIVWLGVAIGALFTTIARLIAVQDLRRRQRKGQLPRDLTEPPKSSWIVGWATVGTVLIACSLISGLAATASSGAAGPNATSTSALVSSGPTNTPAPTAKPTPTAQPTPTDTPVPPPPTCIPGAVNCNPWGYNFNHGSFIYNPPSEFCSYFACISNFDNGSGYVIQCSDGMFSKSGGRSGSCSHHGGEKQILYAP